MNIGSGSSAKLGISDYAALQLQFLGPFPASGTPQLTDLAGGPYANSADNAYVVFVSYDSSVTVVQNITFTTDSVPPVTYSISGTVTDGNGGGPLACVLITINPGNHHDTTDGSGQYSICNLGAGSYTATASFNVYDFSPPSNSVDVGLTKATWTLSAQHRISR